MPADTERAEKSTPGKGTAKRFMGWCLIWSLEQVVQEKLAPSSKGQTEILIASSLHFAQVQAK